MAADVPQAPAVLPEAEEAAIQQEIEENALVLGDTIIEENNANNETSTIRQILHWIGFRIENHRENLRGESLGSMDDMLSLTEKDVTSISSDWANRTVALGRFYIGTKRLKSLQSLIHWIQDFRRVSGTPSIVGLNEYTFKAQLARALDRSVIRKSLKDQTATTSSEASPGPLDNERKWKQWEEKFVNYTRSHIGANGIPLSYVIRENDEPAIDNEYTDFVSKTIYCAPLEGEFYIADRMTIFNMIISFTTGQPSGDWIKNTMKYSDGRRSMKALRAHFAGEGNASRNMAEADRLKEHLHYKSERAMSFETFLTQCQKMYNIYEKEGEEMAEDAKVRFLFKRIQNPDLKGSIEALKARLATGDNVTYTQAANHISTAVSELPEFLSKNRNISGTTSTSSKDENKSSGIYNADGTIITGHIPSWRTLTPADRNKVFAERERLGISKRKNPKDKGAHNEKAANANRMKQITEQNKKYKRQINALKRYKTNEKANSGSDDDNTDAGDQFGGKHSKKKSKN
jgi:hypothetical protein